MALPALRSRSTGSSNTPSTQNASATAPLSRWDPARELTDLQETFGRLVESVFGPAGAFTAPGAGLPALQAWRPLADLSETDSSYVVEIEVPGLKRDDVTIELVGPELVVHGQYQQSEKTGVLRQRNRRYGQFEYRVALPSEVNADEVTADLADGVLTVTVPKSEAAKPRRIQITAR